MRPPQKDISLGEVISGSFTVDRNAKNRKRSRRRTDPSISPSSSMSRRPVDSSDWEKPRSDVSSSSVSHVINMRKLTSSNSFSSSLKGWYRDQLLVTKTAPNVGAGRPPRAPSPMTSPTSASGRGGSTSSSHGAGYDSGVSSNGGGSTSGMPRSSRRENGRPSSLPRRPPSSYSSSAVGLNTSMSASSLATTPDALMNDSDSSTLRGASSLSTIAKKSIVADRILSGQPGAVGIVNYNYTCFINAVVQCLGHTATFVADLLTYSKIKQFPVHTDQTTAAVRMNGSSSPMLFAESCDESDGGRGRAGRAAKVSNGNSRDEPEVVTGRRRRRGRSESEADSRSKFFTLPDYHMRRTASGSELVSKIGEVPGGHVTDSLARLISCLWVGRYSTEVSRSFYETVRHLAVEWYNATEQHDAHEFLVWILDRLNDELKINGILKSNGNETSSADVSLSDVSKNGTLSSETGSSLVQQLFSATCRSTLVCPGCRHQSEKLEPYLSVSLPIAMHRLPQPAAESNNSDTSCGAHAWQAVYVTVVRRGSDLNDGPKRPVRYGVKIDSNKATVNSLKQKLSRICGISEKQMVLAEVRGCGFYVTLHDLQPVSDLRRAHTIYAFETLPPKLDGSPVNGDVDERLREQTVSVIALNIDSKYARRLSQPFVVRVKQNVTYNELQKTLTKQVTKVSVDKLLSGIKKQIGDQASSNLPFRMRVLDGLSDVSAYLDQYDPNDPLCVPTVQEAIVNCTDGYGPQHIKLILEWDYKARVAAGLHTSSSDDVVDDETYTRVRLLEEQEQSQQRLLQPQQLQQQLQYPIDAKTKLAECLKTFTQMERLDKENSWLCPNCHQTQQGAMKKLTFSSLPDILVIHLKRFQQRNNGSRIKLDTLVEFPAMDALDLTRYVVNGKGDHSSSSNNYVYHLYAVCNHFGATLQSGHYTAFCRSPHTGEWHSFDDQHVSSLRNQDIITKNAYLLFYERRCTVQYNDAVSRIVSWVKSSRKRNIDLSVTSIESTDISFDSSIRGYLSRFDNRHRSSARISGRRARQNSPASQNHRINAGSPVVPKSSVSRGQPSTDVVRTTVESVLDSSSDSRVRPAAVTEEFKERTQPQYEHQNDNDDEAPKPARNPPPSCLKKTQYPDNKNSSKFPLWNVLFPKKLHSSHRRPPSVIGFFSEDLKSSRHNRSSSVVSRSRTGRLFRSLSAGRVHYDDDDDVDVGDQSDAADKSLHDTSRRRVRWDPSSEIHEEKRRRAIPQWKRPCHMVLQESSV